MAFSRRPSVLEKYAQNALAMFQVYWLGLRYSTKQLISDHPSLFFFTKWLPFLKPKEVLCYDPKQWPQISTLLKDTQNTQRVVVITGGNGTVGKSVLDMLNTLHFSVVAIGRRRPPNLLDKGEEGHSEKNRSLFVECDLADLRQVTKAVKQIKDNFDHVDLMVTVSGVMLEPHSNDHPVNQVEPHLMINLLSPIHLFTQLRPLLEASPCRQPRAIFVSSATCHAGDAEDFIDEQLPKTELWNRQMPGYKSYVDSKLLLSLYVYQLGLVLAGEAESSKIRVSSVHPGVVASSIYRHLFLPYRLMLYAMGPLLRSSQLAAAHVLSPAFDDNLKSGAYYENGSPVDLRRKCCGFSTSHYTHQELENLEQNVHQAIRRNL